MINTSLKAHQKTKRWAQRERRRREGKAMRKPDGHARRAGVPVTAESTKSGA
jgi:hypothetical protein